MPLVVGIDGYKDRWVAVVLTDGIFTHSHIVPSLRDVATTFPTADAIGVDVPIGFGTFTPIPRACDHEARTFLGSRRSTIFMTFPKEVYEASTHADAVSICRARDIGAPSIQSWGLRKKLLEAAEHLAPNERVYEVHPELSFEVMTRSTKADSLESKHTQRGLNQRRTLLEAQGIDIPQKHAAARAKPDDVLDAAAAAWSAHRIATNTAQHFPINAATQPHSVIWY